MRTFSSGVFQNDSLYCPSMPLKYTGCSLTLAVNTTSCPGVMRMLPSYDPCPHQVTNNLHWARVRTCRYSGAEVDDDVWHLTQEGIEGGGVVLGRRNIRGKGLHWRGMTLLRDEWGQCTGHAAALPCDLKKSMSDEDRFDADKMMLRAGTTTVRDCCTSGT